MADQTPSRKWVPSIFIDDVCPKPRDRPEEWIATHPNGAKWLFSDDATEQPTVRIDLDDVVRFRWIIDHGTFQITVHPNGSWTCDGPLPEGANGFMAPGEPDSYAETMDQFVRMALDVWSIPSDELGPVQVFTWSDDIPFQLFKHAGGQPMFREVVIASRAGSYQEWVGNWMQACFGPVISADRLERGDRLLEEVLELLQSGDYPRERVAALENYVYTRPKGEPAQEVGGVMVTLAAYCLAHELDMQVCGDNELTRVFGKIEQIRAKQAAKPTGSALPIAQNPEA